MEVDPMTIPVRALMAILVGTLLLVDGQASAQEPARRRPEQITPTGVEDSAQPLADDQSGVRTLDAITNQSLEGLTFEQRGDGTIGVDLQGRFMNVLMATPGADGHLDVSCITDPLKLPPAAAIAPWTPSRRDSTHRLNVVGRLPAPIAVERRQPAPLEER
jgi:hypothetical protein